MTPQEWAASHADIYHALGTTDSVLVQGRLVEEPAGVDPTLSRPTDQIRESERKNKALSLIQGQRIETQTNDEGYFEVQLGPEHDLLPGRTVITATSPGDEPIEVGRARLTILPVHSKATVVLSDIDLTWLNTHFHSTTDKMQLLRSDARHRVSFPGMAEVYQQLRASLNRDQPAPLAFLSGSPRFFKRVIEGKLSMDGIEHDALILKPFKGIAWRKIVTLRPHRIVGALMEQVGYKLMALLQHRARLPTGCPELLLGDDSEGDFVSYHIYAHILQGPWRPEDLDAQLTTVNVRPLERAAILALAEEVSKTTTIDKPIRFIGIRRTGKHNPRFDTQDWARPEIILHDDALQLALALVDRGFLPLTALAHVRRGMLESGTSPETLMASLDAAIESGLVTNDAAITAVRRVL